MPQPVQSDLGHPRGLAQLGEPVPQPAGSQPAGVARIGGEQPRPEPVASGPGPPRLDAGLPQVGTGGPQRQTPHRSGLGRPNHLPRRGSLNSQDPAVQVSQLKGCELAAAGTGIGGQAAQQQDLLGPMHVGPGPPVTRASREQVGLGTRGPFGVAQQLDDLGDRDM